MNLTLNAPPTVQTSLSFASSSSDDPAQRTVPSVYRGGGRTNYGRFHSFSIPSNQHQKPERATSSKRPWKRSSAASTSSRLPAICYGYASASYHFQNYAGEEEVEETASGEGDHTVPTLVVSADGDGDGIQEERYPDQEENFDAAEGDNEVEVRGSIMTNSPYECGWNGFRRTLSSSHGSAIAAYSPSTATSPRAKRSTRLSSRYRTSSATAYAGLWRRRSRRRERLTSGSGRTQR